ncbi:MAG: DNA-directed RNA polymerase subunit omega [Bacillaceae bacterium]|nr:DNA-directed RNA polymerase subunit omega [Bacillaceae bacterium]
MLYPSIDELVKKVDSKYTLVSIASKRARQLRDNARVLIEEPKSKKFVGVALEEIVTGKVSYEQRK